MKYLLDQYPEAYTHSSLDIGVIRDPSLELSIEVTELPKKQKIYPIPPPLLKATREIINELVEVGVLKEGIGPCTTPCFLVPKNSNEKLKMNRLKENGEFNVDEIKWRFICDYRHVNRVVIEKYSGQSSISHIYNLIRGKKYITLLDVSSAFYQIPLSESSKYLTQISLDGGLGSYFFQRVPMGLTTSPSALQYVMSKIFNPKISLPNGKFKVVNLFEGKAGFYMDDIVVCSDTPEEMFETLKGLFQRLTDVGFKISIKKAEFFVKDKTVELLGFLVDKEGLQITKKKLQTAEKMVRPTTVKELQRVLGFFNYISGHVPNFQDLACSLTDSLSKTKGTIDWSPSMEKSFQDLKDAVLKNIKLFHINYEEPLFLQCDASDNAAGFCLLQFIDEQVKINNFYSVKFPSTVRKRYSIVAKEALAVILGVTKFRQELEAVRERAIITDSSAIVFILSGCRAGNSRLARLAMTLLSMPMKVVIKHRSGNDNIVPDVLSRFFHEKKPHLKLRDPYGVEKEELKSLGLKDGEITTMAKVNEAVNSNKEFVVPFLQNKDDACQVEETYTLPQDLLEIITYDNSIEGIQCANLIQPVFQEVGASIEGISLASREIKWHTLIKAQRKDPKCMKHINQALISKRDSSNYMVENGLLFRKRWPERSWESGGNKLIYIPHQSEIISFIIHSFHFGHHGMHKMMTVIKAIFYIPHLRRYLLEFVKGCGICAIMRLGKEDKSRKENHLFQPTHPMQVIDIDFFYLPKVGNFRYVLNIVDRFSHKVFAVPTTKMASSIVVKSLEKVFSLAGPPQMICGDNQISLLRSREVVEFANKWNTSIRTGIFYNSRSQALVEALNGSLKYVLKSLVIQHQNDKWYELVPLANYLLNTSYSRGLPAPLCPDTVFFGREIAYFPISRHKISGHVLPEEYVSSTKEFHDKNRAAILEYTQWKRRKPPKDSANCGTPFSPGKYVYFRTIQQGAREQKGATGVRGIGSSGVGVKYMNTIFRIDKVFNSWVEITDIFRVTKPPYRLTTSIYFLKPFEERSPFLFSNIKPDQSRIGGPLLAKDLPTGDQVLKDVPSIYDPDEKRVKKQILKEKQEEFSDEDEDVSSVVSGNSEPNRDADNPLMQKNEVDKTSNPPIETSGTDDPVKHGLPLPAMEKMGQKKKNFGKWFKNAVGLSGRVTRSGKKF